VIVVDDLGLQLARLANPSVLVTIIVAGFAYGWLFLGAFSATRFGRLWMLTAGPGVIFIAVVWTIRWVNGAESVIYPVLLLDWVIFGSAGAISAWLRHRRQKP
jgi:hypothetical protein